MFHFSTQQIVNAITNISKFQDLFAHAREMDAYNSHWTAAAVSSSGDSAHQVSISTTLYEQLFVMKVLLQLFFAYSLSL